MSKKLGSIVIVGLVILFVWMGYDYLHYRSVNAVSDAAFIKSDRIAILSFKVGGKMVEVTKSENTPVRQGETLARIDPRDFLVTKEKIVHAIAALERSIEALETKRQRLAKTLREQETITHIDIDAIARKMAALAFRTDAAKKRLHKLDLDTARYKAMLKDRLIAQADYEKIATARDALQDDIGAMGKEKAVLQSQSAKARKAAQIAHLNLKQIAELDQSIAAKKEELASHRKNLEAIENKIAYTELKAPFDGVIAKKFTGAPRVVKRGSSIYALADPKALYCEVLLSEKKLHGVEPGNDVTIEVDAVKDKTYHGKVETIAPTSAATFSLVPRDIASGEFTKLDQRFVVRIKLDDIEGLRAGMGATVAIARTGD